MLVLIVIGSKNREELKYLLLMWPIDFTQSLPCMMQEYIEKFRSLDRKQLRTGKLFLFVFSG